VRPYRDTPTSTSIKAGFLIASGPSAIGPSPLLHVDVDLYKPTLQSLEFFWPRIAVGGVVVCDDYGFTTCPGARRAMDNFLRAGEPASFELTTGQALAIKAGA
jgi:hypothetical protein